MVEPKKLKKAEGNMPLAVKYRPADLADVVGQEDVVDALEQTLKRGTAHAFLFTGPSGVGKTTLARIVCKRLGVASSNIIEVDAASNSGVDPMREVVAASRYLGFGDNPGRAVIIDECHALSKQAWQSLLKPIEEPPAHVYFLLCTTDPGKVPATIVTRCQNYKLREVPGKALFSLLDRVSAAEGMDTPDSVLERILDAANGSPRQALTLLDTVRGVTDDRAVANLLAGAQEDPEIIDLCRAIANRAPWSELMALIKGLPSDNAEGARIVISRYLASCAMGAKDRVAPEWVHMLDCFHEQFNSSDGLAPLILAIGKAVFNQRKER